ncbi:MAG: hypothetical protein ABIY52_16815 [Gemmatimonadaceae bacterium]
MLSLRTMIRASALTVALMAAGACSQAGSLGSVLGSVLGGGQQQQSQVSGTIQNVDTRNAQIGLRQSNGQTVALLYDANTKVVYQNQNYAVTNLEYGDAVTARIQQTQNGSYYTDLVQVDQSVSTSNGTTGTGNVQTLQGSVRRIDSGNGSFTLDVNNSTQLTVTMPYNPTRNDLQRFQNLRVGDVVRFGGVYLNNTRVELRQFY